MAFHVLVLFLTAIVVVLSDWNVRVASSFVLPLPTTTTTTTTTTIITAARRRSDRTTGTTTQQSMTTTTTTNQFEDSNSSKQKKNKTAIVAGATGYIGKSVVREAVRQGYTTIALVRDKTKHLANNNNNNNNIDDDDDDTNKNSQKNDYFQGAIVVECDVTNWDQVQTTFTTIQETYGSIDAIISCLASRSGTKQDAYLIDYQATLHCLKAGQTITTTTTTTNSMAHHRGNDNHKKIHFVLLSAFCVKKPTLQFQQAKLKFEAALTQQTDLTYTIVRPTAFFKSVSGQLEVVQSGAPFVMFGNGDITRCNPIAETDLATYMIDCITDDTRKNKIINLGGPDDGFNMQEQGKMLFEITGMPEKYIHAPVWIFDAVINTLQFLADLTKLPALEDAAETGRIGKYYAVEDMWTTDPAEKYGQITLREHYQRIAQYGQEYDPYTTMFARARGVDVKTMREQQQQAQQTAPAK